MRKRLWVTLPLCLLAGAAFAATSVGTAAGGTARATISATLHVTADNTDVDKSDPGLAYGVLSWQTEYETCSTLVGYTDHSGKVSNAVTPIGAAGNPVITNGGKTYTFTIRSGMHFSNGAPITAANYQYAINRDASKSLNSPVTAFVSGIVGWTKVNNGQSSVVSGVKTSGSGAGKLTISLTKADGTFLAKLAMPFFCPLYKGAPFYVGGKWQDNPGVHGVTDPWPGSGPYYLFSRTVGSQEVLKKNPHYSGPEKSTASTIIIDMNTSTDTAYNGIEAGTYASDLNGNPEPANNQTLAKNYGVNKSRFWVEPTVQIAYLAMNQARPTFKASHTALRQAVNDAINRPGIQKIAGYLSGILQTQALPKPLAGKYWKAAYAYPITTPNQSRYNAAKKLGGNCAGGAHINFWHGTSAPAIQAASLDQISLQKIGCTVNSVGFAGYDRYTAAGIKGNSMDIMTAGWSDDYPDGYDWFGILFNGRTIVASQNNDLAYMNNKTVNSKTDACNKLVGQARTNCWGALDQWMTKNVAPWASEYAPTFIDYIAPNAHHYVYDAPFASVDLGLFYQS